MPRLLGHTSPLNSTSLKNPQNILRSHPGHQKFGRNIFFGIVDLLVLPGETVKWHVVDLHISLC